MAGKKRVVGEAAAAKAARTWRKNVAEKFAPKTLGRYPVKLLRDLARRLKVRGRSAMCKADLMAAILEAALKNPKAMKIPIVESCDGGFGPSDY